MSYFGRLKGYQLGGMDTDERNKLFVAEGLFQHTFIVSLSEGLNQIYPPKDPPVPKPKKELLDSLHGYLLKQFENMINSPYYTFFLEFNDEILGLDQESERNMAAKYYRVFSDQIMTKVVRFFHTSTGKGGIERVRNIPKMEMLLAQREALKSNLVNSPSLIPYLEGNKTYFEEFHENSKKILKTLLEFEIVFKILSNLNDLYGFEVMPNPNNQLVIKKKVLNGPQQQNSVVQQRGKTKRTMLTEKEAIKYLIDNIFSKK